MAGKGFRLSWTPTTVNGEISESMSSWTQIVNGSVELRQIILSASKNVSFDFRIVSPTGNNIYIYRGNAEILNDSPNIIMRGTYTFVIENVKIPNTNTITDDTFTGEFMFADKKDK